MFNATEILIDAFVTQLKSGYQRTHGNYKIDYADIIAWAGSMALENIANSDALYHNVEHTILVSLVGQEILRGRHIREGGVSPEDWLHFMISLVCHDIGYVRGVCRGDRQNDCATGVGDRQITLPAGATDASLTPYHIDRGKCFIDERFGGHALINTATIKHNLELTRFPVPATTDHQDTLSYPALIRAADLIGQLSDPRYLKKIPALFYEFAETGVNQALGYQNPGDLRSSYSQFYWKAVYPYVKDALHYLSLTQQGQQITASLYANVFMVEHSGDQQISLAVPQPHRVPTAVA
jgi:hypothetical protein